MPIRGPAWGKGIQENDRSDFDALVAEPSEVDRATGAVKSYYKEDLKTGVPTKQYKGSTFDLELKDLEKLRDILKRGNQTFIGDDVQKIEQEIKNRKDPAWVAEQKRIKEEREAKQGEREARLLAQGRTALGGAGDTWAERSPEIEAWWKQLQKFEEDETWAAALSSNRISARQIGTSTTMGGSFAVRNKDEPQKPERDRQITLNRGRSGIGERMTPENFYEPASGARRKNEKGLHDLSASLIEMKTKGMTIFGQLKPYKDSIVVFMPVPRERDMQIFDAIAQLRDPDLKRLRTIRSQMTRIKLAQGSDMHTTLFDTSEKSTDPAKIRYGVTGRTQRDKKSDEIKADEIDIRARKTNALEHSSILGAGAIQKINEIVVAYRKHANALFPVFAQWDASDKQFYVLNATGERAGPYIKDDGTWVDPKKGSK
jgi:hypothetical protein